MRAAGSAKGGPPTPSLLRWPDLDPPLSSAARAVALRLLTQSSAEAAKAAGGEADAAEAEAPIRADHPLLPAILGLLQSHAEHLSSAALEVESHEALQEGEWLQGEVESREALQGGGERLQGERSRATSPGENVWRVAAGLWTAVAAEWRWKQKR